MDSPYLTMAEAAIVARRPSAEAFVKHARRVGLPLFRDGARLLIKRTDLEKCIEKNRAA